MPAITYQLNNHLGSVNFRLSSTGSIVDREEYYPFGDSSVRTWAAKRYRYTGKEKDAESGLYYYGARYYSAWTCRFISVDPLIGQTFYQSSFAYADNNPVMMNDPTGMASEGGEDPKHGNVNSTNLNLAPGEYLVDVKTGAIIDNSKPGVDYDLIMIHHVIYSEEHQGWVSTKAGSSGSFSYQPGTELWMNTHYTGNKTWDTTDHNEIEANFLLIDRDLWERIPNGYNSLGFDNRDPVKDAEDIAANPKRYKGYFLELNDLMRWRYELDNFPDTILTRGRIQNWESGIAEPISSYAAQEFYWGEMLIMYKYQMLGSAAGTAGSAQGSLPGSGPRSFSYNGVRTHLTTYSPGPNTGFSGVMSLKTGQIHTRASYLTTTKSGTIPKGRVIRNGGHGLTLRSMGGNVKDHVAFTLHFEKPGDIRVSFRSASVNGQFNRANNLGKSAFLNEHYQQHILANLKVQFPNFNVHR